MASALDWWLAHKASYEDLISKLEEAGYEVQLTRTGLDITGCGGKKKLEAAFKLLRRAGWEPTFRPTDKTTYYSSFFYNEAVEKYRVYLSYSSDVCRRVQVGTRFEEVPIYEIQCSESMELSEDLNGEVAG